MARTESTMLELGTVAPDFKLIDTVSQETMCLQDIQGQNGTVIMFICNHCPFVIHVNPEIIRLAAQYRQRGIGFVAISSNDIEKYPQDAPHLMNVKAKEVGYPFPYLYDETQQVAKDYQAACTPDFYVFNGKTELVYRGQLDDSRPGNQRPLDGRDIRNALDNLLAGKDIDSLQRPSIGCGIKWK